MAVWQHKRGDTLALIGTVSVRDGDNEVTDLTGWTGKSQVRGLDGTLIADLTFAWVDAAKGIVRLTHTATTAWPVCTAAIDIRFTSANGSLVLSTGVANFMIVSGVTRD